MPEKKIFLPLMLCVICLESINQNRECVLNCHHVFHYYCIHKWFWMKEQEQSSKLCPCCRTIYSHGYLSLYGPRFNLNFIFFILRWLLNQWEKSLKPMGKILMDYQRLNTIFVLLMIFLKYKYCILPYRS